MNNLRCSVTSCGNNCDLLCKLDSIQVEGQCANTQDQTFCRSFIPRDQQVCNSRGMEEFGSELTQIGCDADTCSYNKSCRCTAEQVDVCGNQACTCSDTECATFRCTCGQEK